MDVKDMKTRTVYFTVFCRGKDGLTSAVYHTDDYGKAIVYAGRCERFNPKVERCFVVGDADQRT
jgi:hypothetical protein